MTEAQKKVPENYVVIQYTDGDCSVVTLEAWKDHMRSYPLAAVRCVTHEPLPYWAASMFAELLNKQTRLEKAK